MTDSPRISIIMATYNRANFIMEALESIRKQTYEDWECLIIDDGGSDDTEEVIANLLNEDSRFRFLKRTTDHGKGLPGSRNMGLDLARGDYIIFFDDDDIVHPKNIETCISVLENKAAYFCRYDKRPFKNSENLRIDEISGVQASPFLTEDIDKMITGEIPFASCGVMWKKQCFEKIRFNEDLMYAEEWECYTRILIKGFQGVSINEVLYFNRKHSNSNTGQFYKNDPVRRDSYIKAIKMVIGHLKQAGLLSRKLEIFFLRIGFFLQEYSIIKYTLEKSEAGKLRRIKFNAGYKLYPVLRPVFILKKKLKDLLK